MNLIASRLEHDPTLKAVESRRIAGHRGSLAGELRTLRSAYASEPIERLLAARMDAAEKRRAAREDATKVFAGSPLDGIGSSTWRLLWQQARMYAETEAYPGQAFPVVDDGSRCVLCQQPLEAEAKERFARFETFVKGGLEAEASAAEALVVRLTAAFPDLPDLARLESSLQLANKSEPESVERAKHFISKLRERRTHFVLEAPLESEPALPEDSLPADLESLANESLRQAELFEEDIKSQNRPELMGRQKELRAKKWLSDQATAIRSEIAQLRLRQRYHEADRLANTRALSDRSAALSETLVTEAFRRRMQVELANLRASHIRVEITKARTVRAQVLHHMVLNGAKSAVNVKEVLSEGEYRIVSIAAFLADTVMENPNSPVVFDDPISSLDVDFEECSADRLAELAETRQVIVFTHRLSMICALEEASKKRRKKCSIISVSRASDRTGLPGAPPFPAQKPMQALNTLIEERVKRAKARLDNEGADAYYDTAKSLCTDIRITLERIIECELLADVVQRFRRSITTLNKLHKVASVTAEDCAYIDALMTRYSFYEHSQPLEAPIRMPSPEEITKDLEELKEWLTRLNKRADRQ